jgi:flagellar biosynthesis protein
MSPPAPARPLAVALDYQTGDVPRVVAVGRGELGRRIIDTAREHGVPLEENPGLAEALSTIELDEAIPEALYRAVAEILGFILRAAGQVR